MSRLSLILRLTVENRCPIQRQVALASLVVIPSWTRRQCLWTALQNNITPRGNACASRRPRPRMTGRHVLIVLMTAMQSTLADVRRDIAGSPGRRKRH